MFFVDSDFFEGDGAAATFGVSLKSGGNGQVFVKVYATSGMIAKNVYIIEQNYTTADSYWMQPRVIATNPSAGLLGIPNTVVASGCVGWVQVRGPVSAASFATASQTGEVGHAVFWASASGLKSTGSAYIGAVHQVGVLLEEIAGGNSANIYLSGKMYAQSIG